MSYFLRWGKSRSPAGTNKKAQGHENGENFKKITSTWTTTTSRKSNQVSFLFGVFTDSAMAWCGYGWNIAGMEEKDVLVSIKTDKISVHKRIKINL